MSNRCIVVLADGLKADVAESCMGYLGALREAGILSQSRFACDLPGLSRPLYATLLTGLTPLQHGILDNGDTRSCGRTILHDARDRGRRVAVVAYHWFFELLSGNRFDPWTDRDRLPVDAPLDAARWYWEDSYPDSHTLADAEALRRQYDPDWLLIHPMGPDDAGHRHGGHSAEYRYAARRLDSLLSQCLPRWREQGYDVVITSDHGMGDDRMHGGSPEVEREVSFMWIPHGAHEPRPTPQLPSSSSDVRRFLEHVLDSGE